MKVVPAFVARGLVLAGVAWLAACSGTPTDSALPTSLGTEAGTARTASETDPTPGPAAATVVDANRPASSLSAPTTQGPGSQGPGAQQGDVGQQRREFLIRRSIEEARRSMDLRLWSDAARIAQEVLEMEPANQDARGILIDAQSALGVRGVEQTFVDKVRQEQVASSKAQFEAQQELTVGDALVEQGKYGDAIVAYERGLLLLRYSPTHQPGDQRERALSQRLESAKQAKVQAEQAADQQRAAASQAELADQERRQRIERQTRVKRLLEQANFDFQVGKYDEAVKLLDRALANEPNNANALQLRDLAARARHETRLDVLRQDWKAEWAKTFDELSSLDVPQTDPVVYDMERWREVVKRKPLHFSDAEEIDSAEERAIIQKLHDTKIEHRFTSATVQDWANYYAGVTEITFVVTPAVKDLDATLTTLADFHLPPMTVHKALDVIANLTKVGWKVENGVVHLVPSDKATGKKYLVQYEVRDVVTGVKSKPGPELKLKAPGDEDAPAGDEAEEPKPTVVDAGKLTELIRSNIETASWDTDGASLTEQRGVLLVRHTRQVHERIEKLLADLRQAVGIQVDVEARFLQVDDSFLEDIGVDFRGLGNQASQGLPGRGLERNNRSLAGFDDFGNRSTINPATPGELGTGTEPGFFFDDGGDGDLMGRSEHLFDRTLGLPGGLDNSGGLSLQYAYLDDTELEVVLRAVDKNERNETITAPRLLIYNNTRAHMSVLRHTSYIRDFDVEIAQAAAVANPLVDVVRDGVVLDVRPVVSADRRFITMELRPTVMTLQLPIPAFTTTLGVGQPVQIQLPAVTLQRVRTTVTIPDGGTLMLGGMKLATKQYQVSGVPILKDLPGLSFLFSRKGTYILNRKILILLRAMIVIPSEHLPDLAADELTATLSGR